MRKPDDPVTVTLDRDEARALLDPGRTGTSVRARQRLREALDQQTVHGQPTRPRRRWS